MKSEIFFSSPAHTASDQFNAWMAEHPTARIATFQYQQPNEYFHSICILYWELEEDGGLAS